MKKYIWINFIIVDILLSTIFLFIIRLFFLGQAHIYF
jgi:hypothetical protein